MAIRSLISCAARFVNIKTRMSRAFVWDSLTSLATRSVRTAVFPVPVDDDVSSRSSSCCFSFDTYPVPRQLEPNDSDQNSPLRSVPRSVLVVLLLLLLLLSLLLVVILDFSQTRPRLESVRHRSEFSICDNSNRALVNFEIHCVLPTQLVQYDQSHNQVVTSSRNSHIYTLEKTQLPFSFFPKRYDAVRRWRTIDNPFFETHTDA